MTDLEEILEEAKRRYPIGTAFRVAHLKSIIRTVESHERYENSIIEKNKAINLLTIEKSHCKGASVYIDGEWAEIVSYPKGYVPEHNYNLILVL